MMKNNKKVIPYKEMTEEQKAKTRELFPHDYEELSMEVKPPDKNVPHEYVAYRWTDPSQHEPYSHPH